MKFSEFIEKTIDSSWGEVNDFCEDIRNKDMLYRFENINSKDDVLFESYTICDKGYFLQAAINAWCEFKELNRPIPNFDDWYWYNKFEKTLEKKSFLALKEDLGDEVFDYFPQYKKRFFIEQRIKRSLRSRLYTFMKGKNKNSSFKYVGCNFEQLKNHFESKFTKGMTWENYGKWHIDHIKPCALFNLTIEKEIYECFNYTNLQPLWAKDNLSKGAKWEI
jgi:hypothetical protein